MVLQGCKFGDEGVLEAQVKNIREGKDCEASGLLQCRPKAAAEVEVVGEQGLPRQWDRDSSLEAVLARWRRTWLLFQGH